MENLRITSRNLTDGSEVFAVQFGATHKDGSVVTVTVECNGLFEARRLYDSLIFNAAYAETEVARKGPKRVGSFRGRADGARADADATTRR